MMRWPVLFSGLLLTSTSWGTSPTLDFDFSSGGNAAGHPVYDPDRGFGFEADAPTRFSVRVAEGNYRVTLRFNGAYARVLAEQRRLMLDDVAADKPIAHTVVVNVRTATLPALPANATGGTRVALKTREMDSLTWDDKLTLEITGGATLRSLSIAPIEVPTLYLAGDSTVTDQPVAPNASWGQMLPAHFSAGVAIANHAESGETLKSFVTELRLEKLLSTLEAGDWVMIQFAHNDQKPEWPQTYADAATTYRSWLRTYIAEVRRRGATPLLVTSPERRNFDDRGCIVPSLGEYPAAMRAVALQESVALIDLTPLSVRFYESLGAGSAPRAFADEGRDRTHHNEYGARALAGLVVKALLGTDPALTAGLTNHLTASSRER